MSAKYTSLPMLSASVVVSSILFMPSLAGAVDLGTIGPTYIITEPDFIDDMTDIARKRVNSGEWKKVEENVKRGAVQYFENLPALEKITTTANGRSYFLDPSIKLTEPLRDHLGNVLFEAGTVVNPLTVLPLSEPFMFIDGRDSRQLTLARAQYDRLQGRLKLILTAGPFMAISKEWPVAVYYDQQGLMTTKLGIQQVPALVTQEQARLKVEEIKP